MKVRGTANGFTKILGWVTNASAGRSYHFIEDVFLPGGSEQIEVNHQDMTSVKLSLQSSTSFSTCLGDFGKKL